METKKVIKSEIEQFQFGFYDSENDKFFPFNELSNKAAVELVKDDKILKELLQVNFNVLVEAIKPCRGPLSPR